MEEKKGGDLICKRPDSIVEARFNLTTRQNDILDMVFASIENDTKLEYDIDIRKYAEIYNLKDKSSIYSEVKKAVKTFEGKGFAITQKISETKEDREYFAWFSRIKYRDGEGKITVELGQTLKKILLEVKRAIFYRLEYTLNFKSIYSKRLYYYLKLYEDTEKRIDNIDVLREKLECPESYNKYSLFKKKVLYVAYEEINGNSDISFEYKEIKTKNKVTSLQFLIKSNSKSKNETAAILDAEVEDVRKVSEDENYGVKRVQKLISEHDITELEALKILKKAKGNFEIIKEKYDIAQSQGNIKNIVAWILKAIDEDYKAPKELRKTNKFNDYEGQREYDYGELEKKLLGWE